MNVLHIIQSVGPKSFGLGPVALNLSKEQIKLGLNSTIWCMDKHHETQWASESSGLALEHIRTFSLDWPTNLKYSHAMAKAASRIDKTEVSVIHQHGIWTGVSWVTNSVRFRLGIPTVVAPHGSLERWALERSKFKKRFALAFYERRNLVGASCLQACSEYEISGFRDFGLTNPIAVIPNGISQEWLHSHGDAESFRKRFNIPCNKRIMLFLSRISPVKGLPMLIESLSKVRKQFLGWHLIIAGSDEFNHKSQVEERIRRHNLEKQVSFTGPIFDQNKRDAFACADLFVLPTLRENYGIVIAEALAAGVAVLTTTGAPWRDLISYDCGFWVEPESSGIAQTLEYVLNLSQERLASMGEKGKQMVSARHTWEKSGLMTKILYDWLNGDCQQPDFVLLDACHEM